MYRVHYHSKAKKGLKKLVRNQARQILDKIVEIAVDPFANHPNCTKMQDLLRGYRLRVGTMRVVYEVDTESKTMIVWKVGRGSVYMK